MHSGALLKINGTNVEGLKGYKITREKLWKDADRNMNGDVSATLIGVFLKIELVFRDGLDEGQISSLCVLLDQPYFDVAFYDPKIKGTKTARYYASAPSLEILERRRGLFKTFTVSLVPVSKDR